MYTAAMVKAEAYSVDRTCKGLDEWIAQTLVPYFKGTFIYRVFAISVLQIESNGWKPNNFQYEMERRGFVVCVDTGWHYYEVSLP